MTNKIISFLRSKLVQKYVPDNYFTLRLKAKDAFKQFCATEGGKEFLLYMYQSYCREDCISDSQAQMAGMIAQKQLVESLIEYGSFNEEDKITGENN